MEELLRYVLGFITYEVDGKNENFWLCFDDKMMDIVGDRKEFIKLLKSHDACRDYILEFDDSFPRDGDMVTTLIGRKIKRDELITIRPWID